MGKNGLGCERKWSWLNLKFYSGMCLGTTSVWVDIFMGQYGLKKYIDIACQL
jgi:hypothetical protein